MQNRTFIDITFEQFVQKCFMDLLADGMPHAYYEIADYVENRSREENRPWHTSSNSISNALKKLIEDESNPYTRVRHGWYQISHKPALDQWSEILNKATELQEKMAAASQNLPEGLLEEQREAFGNLKKLSDEAIDKTVSVISFWLADLEDVEDGMTADEASYEKGDGQEEEQGLSPQM